MASAAETEPYGKYVEAEDVLGEEDDEEEDEDEEDEDEEDEGEEGEEDDEEDEEASEGEQLASSSREDQSAGPRESAARDVRPEAAPEDAAENPPLVLPPAPTRSSTSRDSTRKSSHQEASTSSAQSAGSLPPINQRSNSQPSLKGSNASSQGASRRSQAASPPLGSPSRGASRYYQAPAPPPPPPKPKPRERHDVSAVDPLYLQTAVYRTVPNVGRMYDWKLQHEVNQALSKQRKQQVQMEKVMEAARVQLQVRDANERAFQQWMAAKKQEKQQHDQENRRIAYVTSVYHSLVKEDPAEHKVRESFWVNNFGGAPDNRP